MSVSRPSRPKLMFVFGLATRKVGGMEKFMRYFTLELDRRGWDTVLCFDGLIADNMRDYFHHPAVTLELVDGQKDLGREAAPVLRQLLRKHRPRVMIYAFHGVLRVFPWMARLAGVQRIFFNDHSSRPMGVVVRPMPRAKRIAGHILTAPLTGIISVCEFVKRSAETIGLSHAPNTVVWNGVEVGEPDPARGRRFRHGHGLPEDALVFTMSVWMVEVKGVDVMLRASVELIRNDPRVWLLLVGDGPLLEQYRELARTLGIADRVVFPGLLSDPVGLGVFDASNVSCQPSLWQEANPLAVLEAMSMQLPVIASDIGGMPEIVKEGVTGLLFPPGDADALRERLTQLAGDAEMRDAMGRAGRARVLEHHQITRVASRYADLLLGELSGGPISES